MKKRTHETCDTCEYSGSDLITKKSDFKEEEFLVFHCHLSPARPRIEDPYTDWCSFHSDLERHDRVVIVGDQTKQQSGQ